MEARLIAGSIGLLLALAMPVAAHGDIPTLGSHASSKNCANTYGGDVLSATNNLACSKARAIVRAWAVGYRRTGQANRTAFGYRCRGRNDSIEGLTVKCRRGKKVVRFYANVPR